MKIFETKSVVFDNVLKQEVVFDIKKDQVV